MKATKAAIHQFLSNYLDNSANPSGSSDLPDPFQAFQDELVEDCLLTEDVFNALKAADIKNICVGSEMSENHLGGDQLVDVVQDTLTAQNAGYTVIAWYGDNTEVLIIGYRPHELEIIDPDADEIDNQPEPEGDRHEEPLDLDE